MSGIMAGDAADGRAGQATGRHGNGGRAERDGGKGGDNLHA